MTEFYDNDRCFVCGLKNKKGLQLNFAYSRERDEVEATVCFQDHYQGWANVIHGGFISTVLDEIMVKAAESKNFKCVTAEMNVKFKSPALIEETFKIFGKIVEVRNKLLFSKSRMIDSNNNTIATASAKLFVVA